MDITVVKIWSSPSTLHLRVMVTYKTNPHGRFADVHIPIADLVNSGWEGFNAYLDAEPDEEVQPTLL